MFCEFSFGAFGDAGLFTQRFPANALLAGLADTAFEYRDWLGADHALFFLFAHKYLFYSNYADCQALSRDYSYSK